jgi:putative flippase GtrA
MSSTRKMLTIQETRQSHLPCRDQRDNEFALDRSAAEHLRRSKRRGGFSTVEVWGGRNCPTKSDRMVFLRYLAVGGLNTAFGYLCYAVFVLAGAPIWLAVSSSTVLAIVFNFFSYGGLVFGDTSHRLLPRFLVFYALLGGLNFLLLRALIWGGLGPLWAQALLLPVLAGVGFVGMRRFVFDRGASASLRHLKAGRDKT